ncbi:MAG: diguanylate cyclase [Tissierellales bacterium]|nr:diguanylate cyclase [Tissierellales bacterium]
MFKSIRTKIFVSFFSIITIVIVVDATLFYYLESKFLNQNAIEQSLAINKLQAEMLGNVIKSNKDRLLDFVEETDVVNLDDNRMKEIMNYLFNKSGSEFFNVFYFDKLGDFVTVEDFSGNIADREYYKIIKQSDEDYFISKPVIGRIRKVAEVIIVVAIRDEDGNFAGGLGGAIQLSRLTQLVRQIEVLPSSYAWIIDSSGEILAHPETVKYTGKNMKDGTKMGFDGLEELWAEMKESKFGSGDYYDGNIDKEKIVTYNEIPSSLGWKLVITTLEEEIYAPAIRLMYIISGISIVLVIILSASTFILSSRIVAPIVKLTRAVGQSRKSEIIQIEDVNLNDEIGMLVGGYNKMAESLHHYTTSLEIMVEERTKELNALNEKLEYRNKKLLNLNDELYTLATTDELTKLLNRSHILEQIEAAITQIQNGSMHCFSIMFIDLDNFKYYNDTFGHDVGDKILIDLGESMKKIFRSTDIIGRYGGDEFIVLLLDTEFAQAQSAESKFQKFINSKNGYSEKISRWLETENVEINEGKQLGISVGIKTYTIENDESIDDLIKLADDAMYEKKRKKKNIYKKEQKNI